MTAIAGRLLARAAFLAALLSTPLGIQSARAQEADSAIALDPIVVRVFRSAVGTGDPVAVSVSAGPELARGHAGVSLEETLRALPGIQIQNRFNLASGERVSIRGFGARAQFGIRGIRVLVDGIPATLPDGQSSIDHLDPGSIGRAELLRGPGSALYGNAAGGVLHLESVPPSPKPVEARARFTTGSDGLRASNVSASGTVGSLSYAARYSGYSSDGFRRDPVVDDGSAYGRQERAIGNMSATLPVGDGRVRLVVNTLDLAAENPGSLSRDLRSATDRPAHRFNVVQDTREDIRQDQIGVTWSGPMGALDGEVAVWGVQRDFEGRIPSSVVTFDRQAGGVRALFHGSGRVGDHLRFTLGGGVEAETQHDDRQNRDNNAGIAGALTLEQRERVRSTGYFVQARVEPRAGVAALAGVRYDRFRFSASDRFLDDGDDSGKRVMRALSPSLGLVVDLRPGTELFGNVTTSFETPTTTELGNRPDGPGGFNPELDPTRTLGVEGGIRTRLDSGWSVEATLFHAAIEDELVPFEVPTSPGRTFFRNAGRSRHEGWEFTVEGKPGPGVQTRIALTRVEGRFDDYAPDGSDLSGNRIPGLAPFRADGRFLFERAGRFVEVRGLYQDEVPVDDANSAFSPAYFLTDIRAGLERVPFGWARWSPFVAITNVFDHRYDTSVVVNAFGGRFYEPGPGRSLQLGLAVIWGG